VPAQVHGDHPVPRAQRPGQRGQHRQVAARAVQKQQRRRVPAEVANGDRQLAGVDQAVVDHEVSSTEITKSPRKKPEPIPHGQRRHPTVRMPRQAPPSYQIVHPCRLMPSIAPAVA
jgi:hypothetical protein